MTTLRKLGESTNLIITLIIEFSGRTRVYGATWKQKQSIILTTAAQRTLDLESVGHS